MLRRYRYILIGLALLGLATSITALVVHYRLMSDPGYSSFCDVNASISCQQVLQSSYATVWGVPIAAGGAIWSAAVLLLVHVTQERTGVRRAGDDAHLEQAPEVLELVHARLLPASPGRLGRLYSGAAAARATPTRYGGRENLYPSGGETGRTGMRPDAY